MLMYRQVAPERNAKFMEQCNMPKHIAELIYKLKHQEEIERRRKEMDRCMCKVRELTSAISLSSTVCLLCVLCQKILIVKCNLHVCTMCVQT